MCARFRDNGENSTEGTKERERENEEEEEEEENFLLTRTKSFATFSGFLRH